MLISVFSVEEKSLRKPHVAARLMKVLYTMEYLCDIYSFKSA